METMSSGTLEAAELFEDLWRQLRECHQNALRELEAKVNKLKKERCLDAQRLEVFYNRNQQLKEQNKTLQETISLLEERLHTGECDRCAILGEDLKTNHDQKLRLVTKLKNERNSLDENRKLHSELQKVKMSCSELQQVSPSEQEEGIIPDSPVLPSSLPVANKLKKRKNVNKIKHVHYAEIPLLPSNNSLFSGEPVDAAKNPGRAEVLVPNTCEMDASQIPNDVNLQPDEAVADTCAFELLDKHCRKTETAVSHHSTAKPSWKNVCPKPRRSSPSCTLIHSPDSTAERSLSLHPRVKPFPEDSSINKAKRKKEEFEPEVQEEDKQENKEGMSKHVQSELIKRTPSTLSSRSFEEPLDSEVESAQNGTSIQRPHGFCASPAFKKPDVRGEAEDNGGRRRRKPLQDVNASHDQQEGEDVERKHRVEPMWSVDPALALAMCDSEWAADEREEQQCHGEPEDTECTWVSHSVLQRWGEAGLDRRGSVSGPGEKANDSLDMMFDTTAYGEYKSFSSSQLGQSQPCEEEEDDQDDDEDPHDNTMSQRKEHKAQRPTFAHVAVVRKKDERRKLKGTTCKECEAYYTHLPEEEKQKKLSACSRHRFLYIPPCTPENFWEVGFPSTQTCIERGYIKEEKHPQTRSRRRQPYTALFSPKQHQQEK